MRKVLRSGLVRWTFPQVLLAGLGALLPTTSDLVSAGAGAALRVTATPPTAKEVTVETAEH